MEQLLEGTPPPGENSPRPDNYAVVIRNTGRGVVVDVYTGYGLMSRTPVESYRRAVEVVEGYWDAIVDSSRSPYLYGGDR